MLQLQLESESDLWPGIPYGTGQPKKKKERERELSSGEQIGAGEAPSAGVVRKESEILVGTWMMKSPPASLYGKRVSSRGKSK